MRPPRSALAVVALLALLALLAPATSAAPPPEGVCGVCGHEFERAAEDLGVDVSVVESELDVRVDADGDSQWTARVAVNERAAERFASNQTLLERAVEETYASYRTVVDDPRDLSVALDDRTLTVTFAVEDAATRRAGDVLLFEGFARDSSEGYPYVDADAVAVRGPPGTAVTHAPGDAEVEGNRSVWTAGESGTYSPRLDRRAVVAFAPDDGVASRAATAGALRLRGLEAVGPGLLEFALVPAALLAVVAGALLAAGNRLPAALADSRRVTRALAVAAVLYGVLAVGSLLVEDGLGFVLGVVGAALAPQAFLTAAVLLLVDAADAPAEWDLGRVAAGAVLAWTLALVLGAPASAALALLFGPLVFLPFGVLAGADRPARLLFPVVAALGPVAAALPFVGQVGLLVVSPSMLTALAAGSAVLGTPLFAVGRRLGGEASAFGDGAVDPATLTR